MMPGARSGQVDAPCGGGAGIAAPCPSQTSPSCSACRRLPADQIWCVVATWSQTQAAGYVLPEGGVHTACSRLLATSELQCATAVAWTTGKSPEAPCMRPTAEGLAGCRQQRPAPRGTPRCSTSASGAPADSWTRRCTVSRPAPSRTCWDDMGAGAVQPIQNCKSKISPDCT